MNYREAMARFTHIDATFVAAEIGPELATCRYVVRFYPWWEHPLYLKARDTGAPWGFAHVSDGMQDVAVVVRLDLSKQENQTPGYLAVSPLGEVPALVDGELTLLEPAAICLHLADRFPEKLLAPPLGSPERGAYYQWLLFAEATLAPVVMALHEHAQMPEEQRSTARAQEALARHRARLGALLDIIDAEIEDRDFLAGGRFSAADLVMASILHLANHLNLLGDRPRLVKYVYLHCRRPACARAVS